LPSGYELAAAGELAFRRVAHHTGSDIAARNSEVIEIDAATLSESLAQGNVRVIDVRTDAEVAEGVIPGAEHIAMDRFDPAALDTSDGRAIVLYCRSGRRSAMVAEKLAEHTGEPAVHLEGGVLAWQASGGALEER
jgi:rhodanese-related sulfurtransferase